MNVLLTSATGYIGSAVAKALQTAGHQVIGMALAAAQQGVRSLVIRPALVYGHGGGLVAMLMQAARDKGAVPVVGDGRNAWSFIHVEDLANLYVRAMEQAPAGTLLIGASGEYLPLQTLALAVAQAAGASDCLHFLTLEQARQTWGLLADAIVLDQKVSGERARQLLHWVPSAPEVLAELSRGSY